MPLIDVSGSPTSQALPPATGITEANTTSVGHAPVVTLVFDGPTDGKAFSAAAVLRSEGYAGTLVGIGPVGIDRLTQGFRVGFDLLEITDTELQQLKPCHLAPFPHHYQPNPNGHPALKKSA